MNVLALQCSASMVGYLLMGGLISMAFGLRFLYDYGLEEQDKSKRLKLCCCKSREGNLASGWVLWSVAFVLYVLSAYIFTRVMSNYAVIILGGLVIFGSLGIGISFSVGGKGHHHNHNNGCNGCNCGGDGCNGCGDGCNGCGCGNKHHRRHRGRHCDDSSSSSSSCDDSSSSSSSSSSSNCTTSSSSTSASGTRKRIIYESDSSSSSS